MRKMLFITLLMGGLCTTVSVAKAQERLPEYLQAEKYTQEKLNTMLFSTVVDPHWFQKGNNFWFEYKTSEGTFWYVVDPVARTKKLLFDRDELASQLTEIVKDPFEARHLPIINLKAKEDGRTFTFEVKSTKDATPKTEGKDKKDKKNEKEIFYFSYDYPTRKLTHLKDKEDDLKKIYWGSVSPDGKTVIYAKDLNLYRMSREDYEKAKKNEKDSTIVEIQLTTDGMKDFGYGIPYSMLNTLRQHQDAVPGQQNGVAVGDDELGIAGDADQNGIAGNGHIHDGLARKLEVLGQQDLVQAGCAAAQAEQLADGIRLDLPFQNVAQVVGAADHGVHA